MERELKVNHLTRVEGHGAVELKLEGSQVKEIKLSFTEGPRFFEFITRERLFSEIPKIVSRICGICYVSHRLAAAKAIEDAFKTEVPEAVELMRRLLIVGEFLESHALHLYFLALPDYMGYGSTVEMAKDYPNVVRRGFKIKEVGNRIMKLLGGKTVHGEAIVAGGFTRAPEKEELELVIDWLTEILPELEATTFLFDSLEYFELESPVELEVSLENPVPSEPSDRVAVSNGLKFTKQEFEHFIKEEVSPYSTAKRSTVNGKAFRIGPLARVNRGEDFYTEETKEVLSRLKNRFPSKNPLLANLARAVEMVELAHRGVKYAERLIELLPFEPKAELEPGEFGGYGVKEAPRGVLYHHYRFSPSGHCTGANIVTPTAQLQACIEEDLKALAEKFSYLPDSQLKKRAEMLIRAYDP
jgi:sulfhydrogenase subunit alpha